MKQKFKAKNQFDRLGELEQKAVKGELVGAVVLDIDGTATVPGKKEEIQPEINPTNAEFVSRGGNLIIPTNRPRVWVEEKIIIPTVGEMEKSLSAIGLYNAIGRIMLSPEQGASGLVLKDVRGDRCIWNKLWEYDLPDKDKIRALLEESVVPQFEGSRIRAGNENIVTLEKLKDPGGAEALVESLMSEHTDIHWDDVNRVKTRSTLTFTHKKARKDAAVAVMLLRITLGGAPVVGFGDLHDEFARIVPTINVSTIDPNVFRRHDLATMELQRWAPLENGQYTTEKEGTEEEIVRDEKGVAMQVVRGKDNRVLRNPEDGNPIKLEPTIVEGKPLEGAGVGTAWFLRSLIDKGYFQK